MSRQDFTFDDIECALRFLNCEDTDVWLRAGMAIKSEFGDSGFDIWNAWSRGDSRYRDKEARARWKSFKGGSARGSVSIGTVLHWAFERGFKIERPELSGEQKAAFAAEQEARRKRVADQAAIDAANEARWYDAVASASQSILHLFKPVGNSPYLGKKKISSCGCLFPSAPFLLDFKPDFQIDTVLGQGPINAVFQRIKENKAQGLVDADAIVYVKRGSIMVPLYNENFELRNLQIIYNDGKTKRFLTNGQKSQLFYVIGSLIENVELPVLFCEGFATGASLHMATQWPVVVCFDAGNLPAVASLERFKNMLRPKIFCGDNDWETALDPKKKNTGVVKAQEAARIAGGTWCVPDFAGFSWDATGLSDFNDLHVTAGLDVVRMQVSSSKSHIEQPLAMVSPDSPLDVPPDYGDVPVADYEDYLPQGESFDSPVPSTNVAQVTVDGLLQRYSLTDPDAKVWDSFQKKIIKSGAFKNIVTPKLYAEWLNHEKRRTVLLDDVELEAAAAQKKGRGGLSDALNRYVYLNPSDTAWDRQEREVVALSHLKYAIADCFAMWVAHPDREEIPMKNLVFDPTQQCDTKTHINQFRGLAMRPSDDIDRCKRIVEMLMGLCNNDAAVFKWLRRWLAYPLINVGAKMETSVLCHSDVHGSGKSYFFDVVMRSIYGEYSRTVGQAQLEGQYNDWMSKVLYCVYEEVLSRSQRYSHTGTIKQTITGKTVRIEKKFMSGWEEANHMNAVFLSNEVMPLPVEPSDRRFLVIWPEKKLYEQLQRGVDEDLRNGGAAAFYRLLLNTSMQDADEEYPFDEHTKPPMTEAKARLIEHGRPIWEVFYYEWANGYLEHNDSPVPFCCIRIQDLYRLFELWCKRYNEHSMGAHKFSSFISSKLKKRRDLHYKWLTVSGKSSFYIVGECPGDKSQEQWLGACAFEHIRILAADNDLTDKAA